MDFHLVCEPADALNAVHLLGKRIKRTTFRITGKGVFEIHSDCAGLYDLLDVPFQVLGRRRETGLNVRSHRNAYGFGDAANGVHHFRPGRMLAIGVTQCIGDSGAAGGDGGEPGVLDDASDGGVTRIDEHQRSTAVMEFQETHGFLRLGHMHLFQRIGSEPFIINGAVNVACGKVVPLDTGPCLRLFRLSIVSNSLLPLGVQMKTVSLEQELNPWEAQAARFDFAAQKLNLEEGLWKILGSPTREIIVHIPVSMDDDPIEVDTGFRVQHSIARGPPKPRLRYSPHLPLYEPPPLATRI